MSVLNGGQVTKDDREDAERFFIRYYQDSPEQELPARYTKYSIWFIITILTGSTFNLMLKLQTKLGK